jgi:hypothetical protein
MVLPYSRHRTGDKSGGIERTQVSARTPRADQIGHCDGGGGRERNAEHAVARRHKQVL